MHILHVLDHSIPLHSGYAFRTLSILREQHALGWRTSHVTSTKHLDGAPTTAADSEGRDSGASAVEDVDGLRFHRTLPAHKAHDKLPLFGQLAVIRDLRNRLGEVVAEVKPDLIHAHSPALNGSAAVAVARRHGIPLVYELRALWEDAAVDHGRTSEGSLRYRLSRALETRVLKAADAVTTISEGLRGDIQSRGVDESKITVIPNAVDIDRFAMARARDDGIASKLGLRTDARVLGFVGSFYRYEGLHLLLDALPAIVELEPATRVVLVGGGFEEQNLRAQVAALGLDEVVHFTGRVPHTEVERYYSLMDVMVYPRLSMRLTELVTPLKPLEAMAQGRLVVASDVGGHREMVRDADTGTLFEAGNSEALAGATVKLLRDTPSWPGMRARARTYVETERSWPASVGRYRDVYEQLLKPRAA